MAFSNIFDFQYLMLIELTLLLQNWLGKTVTLRGHTGTQSFKEQTKRSILVVPYMPNIKWTI